MPRRSKKGRAQRKSEAPTVADRFRKKHDPYGMGMSPAGKEVFRFLRNFDVQEEQGGQL